ncbi:hypothetical protein [Pseudoalteromonas viridis]|uniref:Uncharacterized protein n=1 Tax=Pseudoalteromonas viridis TaxID=339617 RepID=A0ABX7V3J5_9GAMM|nr:hypothetical protein [Pseudoalteromonas viridis]QTL34012.1 hypothetical protein J5X90_10520 [Pseudoalteromonas viridis]
MNTMQQLFNEDKPDKQLRHPGRVQAGSYLNTMQQLFNEDKPDKQLRHPGTRASRDLLEHHAAVVQ